MSAAEVVEQLKCMSNAERLAVIEAATRLVRETLPMQGPDQREERRSRMRAAALAVKDLYEPGSDCVWAD